MDIGMLWYDDDSKRTLNEKVARAVEHYKTKYGAVPTVCFVNPSLLTAARAPELAAGVQLRPARTVMVNHFWVGVGETTLQTEARPGNGARHKNGQGAHLKRKT
ncbi:MAG: hypothetical protein HY784_16145 [Chloroflexi bacterium]|nr:hypothetical protein [Chloroflexota bacterium]